MRSVAVYEAWLSKELPPLNNLKITVLIEDRVLTI